MTYKDYGYRSGTASHTNAYLLSPLLKMLGPPSGPVLDLGCGNGAMTKELMRAGYDAYGVDASQTGIAEARQEFPNRFFVHNFSTSELPIAVRSIQFSSVISTEVIEHLYEPRALLRNAKAALGDGGTLIISTPYHGYLKNVVLAVTGKLDAHFTALWDGGHIKFFSRKTLEALVAEQGYLTLDFCGAGRVPFLWKSMLIKARPA